MEDRFQNTVEQIEASASGPVFIEPLNITDPFVKHDVLLLEQEHIGEYLYNDVDNFGTIDDYKRPTDEDLLSTEGKFMPLVVIDGKRISWGSINFLQIKYTDFLPSIMIEISNVGFMTNVAGQGSTITVIFVPTIDKAFRNIAITFEITNAKDSYNTPNSFSATRYYGEYRFVGLKNAKIHDIIFSGCEDCDLKPSSYPNTYEMLHEIALRTGLGFAATENTNVEDRMRRNTCGEQYIDYIRDKIQYAGVDENSILDCWIDLYGYITLVNLSYIFNEDVDYRRFSMLAAVGTHFTERRSPNQTGIVVNRILTNFSTMGTNANIEIDTECEWINNISRIAYGGNRRSYAIQDNISLQECNDSMELYDIEVTQRNSAALHHEDYYTTIKPEVLINTNPFYNVPLQRKIREAFLDERRSLQLKVRLKQLNFALVRGTLIHVALYETSPAKKTSLVYNIKNVLRQYKDIYNEDIRTIGEQIDTGDELQNEINESYSSGVANINYDDIQSEDDLWSIEPLHFEEPIDSVTGVVTERNMLASEMQMPNWYTSGLYYINGMEFTFSAETEEISQYLYLIKKDWTIKINDKYLPVHFDPSVYNNI